MDLVYEFRADNFRRGEHSGRTAARRSHFNFVQTPRKPPWQNNLRAKAGPHAYRWPHPLRRLHGLTVQSLLALYLQAGVAALNTPRNDPDTAGYNPDDPLCQAEFLALARGLPYSKHIHSSWVCPITKALMDEDNPPVVLPNGFVYSRAAMEEMAARNGGKIVCTRTGDGPFELGQVQKVFLA